MQNLALGTVTELTVMPVLEREGWLAKLVKAGTLPTLQSVTVACRTSAVRSSGHNTLPKCNMNSHRHRQLSILGLGLTADYKPQYIVASTAKHHLNGATIVVFISTQQQSFKRYPWCEYSVNNQQSSTAGFTAVHVLELLPWPRF